MHLQKPTLDQKPLFDQLVQLYAYDFSEIFPATIGDDGRYPVHHCFRDMWTHPDYHPRLIMVDDKVAGFGLVKQDTTCVFHMEQFFVLRKFRRLGVGRLAAYQFFQTFTGQWSVMEIANNTDAQLFWRKVIGTYTSGNYSETDGPDPIQTFTT